MGREMARPTTRPTSPSVVWRIDGEAPRHRDGDGDGGGGAAAGARCRPRGRPRPQPGEAKSWWQRGLQGRRQRERRSWQRPGC